MIVIRTTVITMVPIYWALTGPKHCMEGFAAVSP